MKCPKCNTTMQNESAIYAWCQKCIKTWNTDAVEMFWQGFIEGRNNKKNTTEVCGKFEGCDHDEDGCPSIECGSFVKPR